MRRLLALVNREWRDVRTITWASMALVVVACAVVRWVLGAIEQDVWASSAFAPRWYEPFVPFAIAAYGALIAADSVGGDVASRRSDALALLPAGPARVWTAKLATLLAATAVFAAWTLTVQIAALWAVDGREQAEAFVMRAAANAWIATPIVLFVGATLLVSTLRLRGIGAALVGGAVAAGLWWGTSVAAEVLGFGSYSHPQGARAWSLPSGMEAHAREWFAGALAAPALLVAAGLAYVYGRVHLGRVLRPLAIAVGALVPLVVAPAAVVADHVFSVVPGRAGVSFTQAWPSPDGRFVALSFTNWTSPRQPSKTFVLDVARGALIEPDCGNAVADVQVGTWGGVWREDGRLELVSLDVIDNAVHGLRAFAVDPADGRVVEREEIEVAAAGAWFAARARRPGNELGLYLAGHARVDDGGAPLEARIGSTRGGPQEPVRTWVPGRWAWLSNRLVHVPEPHVVAVTDFPGRGTRVLLTSAEPWTADRLGSVQDDWLLVRTDEGWQAFHVVTGERTPIPVTGEAPKWWAVYGGPPRRIVVLRASRTSETVTLLDLDSGAETVVPASDLGSPRGTADGSLVVMRDHNVLDLRDRDLRLVRRLWPPDAKESVR